MPRRSRLPAARRRRWRLSRSTTLALAQRVAPTGTAIGVDTSTDMVHTAATKAVRTRSSARYIVANAQDLPLPTASADAIVTSLMMHHLPPADRATALEELLRVLRPGGRIVVIDYVPPRGPLARAVAEHLLGHAMTGSDLSEVAQLLKAAGAHDVHHEHTPVGWLGAVCGRKP